MEPHFWVRHSVQAGLIQRLRSAGNKGWIGVAEAQDFPGVAPLWLFLTARLIVASGTVIALSYV